MASITEVDAEQRSVAVQRAPLKALLADLDTQLGVVRAIRMGLERNAGATAEAAEDAAADPKKAREEA